MAVKVLVIATIVVLLHLALADVSHLKLTSSDTNEAETKVPVAEEKESGSKQESSRLQSRNAVLESQQALETNAYDRPGYTYEKPSIPFETGNIDYDGYEYPKPANPMTYPPPSKFATTTDQTFPDATARLRLKKSTRR